MNTFKSRAHETDGTIDQAQLFFLRLASQLQLRVRLISLTHFLQKRSQSERGDVPGWVLVVLMTTGLVTAIWTIAAPRLSAILRNSLDSMNGIR